MATYGCGVDVENVKEARSEAELYSECRTDLVRFANALVGPSDALDAVSDAMESLLTTGALAEAGNPRALMYRAVLAKARSMQRSGFRRRARERRFAELVVVDSPHVRPDVLEAVVRLSARQRASLFLTYWEDLTPSQVGDRLGIGEGTVKKYLARARANLRKVLDE